MIGTDNVVRIAVLVVCLMCMIATCRFMLYADPYELKIASDYSMWLLRPSVEEPYDARYVNAFTTDEDELLAIEERG